VKYYGATLRLIGSIRGQQQQQKELFEIDTNSKGTKGHLRKLKKVRCTRDIAHVVDINSVNVFKARLDRFWMDQDVKFDFTADLTGTCDRSVNVITET